MTATDLPGLVVPIEARITALERGLQKANRAQQRAAAEMEGRAKKSADKIGDTYAAMGTRLAGVMSKALLPLGAALTSGAAIRGVAQIAEGLAKIGDEAARAGLGAEEFQQWAYVAEQARIPVDAMVDAFKELSLRADELLTTGAGPAAEAFRRIGFNATDLKRKLQDPSALMDEIIDRTEKLDRAARLRVFDEIFGGTGGERLVQLLDMGADKVRTMRDRAVDLGLVIDGDVIKKAAELDRKFSEITTRISTLAKTAVVELAEAIEDAFTVDVDEMFGGAERALAMLGEANYRALKDAPAILDDQKDAVNDLQAAYAELARIYNDLTGPTGFRLMDVADVDAAHELAGILVDIDREMQAFENGSQSAEEFQGNMQDLIQEAIDLLANLDAVDSARFTNVIDSINAMAGALANAAAKAREAASALPAGAPPEGVNYGPQNGRGSVKPASKLAPKTSPLPRLPSVDASFGLPDPAKGGGGGGGRSQSDYEREAQSIKEEIAQLELESAALVAAAMAGQRYAGAIEQARREAELLAAAQRDGRELTPALRAEVSAMAAGYQLAADAASQAADRIQAVQDAQAELRDTAKSAFVGLINGTLSWKDALAQVLAQLAEMAASRAFEMFFTGTPSTGGGSSGSSATGDIFAMILGAVLGFDKGGYTGAGPRLEPAGIVHKGEYVLSKRAVDRLGVPGLEALHQSALKGYAGGGLVTGGNTPTVPGMSASKAAAGPSITISSPITVNATGSTPEANTDLANKIARAHRDQMKALVHGELRAALRPGGSLNRG